MKHYRLKYLFIFLFSISLFHLTGASCDEDDNPTGSSGIDEAAIGKWSSTTIPGETQYLEITSDSISVWVKLTSSNCTNFVFKSNYSATNSSMTIPYTDEGSQTVTYTVSGDTLTVVAPDGEGGTITLVFYKFDFDPSTFNYCSLAVQGKWKSTSYQGETQYLLITSDSITTWIKEDEKPCYEKMFTSSYSIDYSTMTIPNTDEGSITVTFSISNDTLTVLAPDGEGGYETIIFVAYEFNVADLTPLCINLEGTWQNDEAADDYLEVVDEDTYRSWDYESGSSCYILNEQESYTFDQLSKTGTFQTQEAITGQGTFKYDEVNQTISIEYISNNSSGQSINSKIEIVQDTVRNTYNKVSDINFNECP